MIRVDQKMYLIDVPKIQNYVEICMYNETFFKPITYTTDSSSLPNLLITNWSDYSSYRCCLDWRLNVRFILFLTVKITGAVV